MYSYFIYEKDSIDLLKSYYYDSRTTFAFNPIEG